MNRKTALLPLAAALLTACAARPSATTAPRPISSDPPATTATAAVAKLVDVYKSPTCSCCHEWEAYMRANGWTVRSHPSEDFTAIKESVGLPKSAWSCHTAIIGGYFVEGHVPVAAIDDMLARSPQIDGIALPGMPAGSPGMPGTQAAPFEILAVADGAISDFGAY